LHNKNRKTAPRGCSWVAKHFNYTPYPLTINIFLFARGKEVRLIIKGEGEREEENTIF